ncbi:MAG: hypothetical protein IT372_22720 [Polyangiaceae bacterium]|nr:hypothetical protein [Polyangiaceae bacterium]
MPRRLPPCAAAIAALLAASNALADRVAVLPPRGGTDDGARLAAKAEILQGLTALGHTAVPDTEIDEALKAAWDGVADTAEEYRAVGQATRADWVVVGLVEPAVQTTHLELIAYLVPNGRLETVARELDRARSLPQTQEMLAVLVRPEGIGAGELPWERAPAPGAPAPTPPLQPQPAQVAAAPPVQPPPAALPVAPATDKRTVVMDYLFERHDVWPAYSAGNRLLLAVEQGFSYAASRPEGATGNPASYVGAARVGYALGDFGLEPFAQIGANLAGPSAVWIDAGARLMLSPGVSEVGGRLYGVSFHVGPEVTLGAFMRPGPSGTGPNGVTYNGGLLTDVSLGAALDVVFAVTPTFQIDARVGNLRWIPADGGALLLLGGTLGAGLRF